MQYLESDADEQLILHIPFKDNVKLKSISVVGEGGDMHPASMKAFKNRDDIDFDNVRRSATITRFGNGREERRL